ncbi:MAG TPA: SRPBCC domain-containing protein [Candidatus Saccharimonadia bacterium]|jgi:uncharacterized protein YndB with AHSA1/START domain
MPETETNYQFEIDRDKLEVRISRIFRTTPERMWQAHTEPKLLMRWWTNTKIDKLDLKPGGEWRFVSNANGQDFTVGGQFKELEKPKKIVRTFEFAPGHSILETTTFEALPNGTTRQLAVSKFANLDDLNQMSKGMQYGAEPGMELLAQVAESED